MISRVRPFFHKSYIESVNSYNPSIIREQYHYEISQKLKKYYPDAKMFEFFDCGRNSLSIGLKLLDIKKDDEILIPCFTCSTILEPILSNNLKPNLYDIEFDFSVNIEQLSKKITNKTKAIILTHFFGIPSNVKQIKDFAESRGLYLIEDCAHTIGTNYSNIALGSIGDFAFTSFGNDKPLSIGNGSILIINNDEVLNKFNEIIPTIQSNNTANEKCSFLSLLFFYLKTERTVYNHFIGVDDFYEYFISHNTKVDLIYQELHKKDIDIFKLSKGLPDFQHNNHFLSLLYNIIKYLSYNPPKTKTTKENQMNCFSLNILNTAIDYIDEINAFRKKIGSFYIKNLSNNNEIIAPILQKNIPFLRYSIICKKSIMAKQVVKKLNLKGYECGNFNWGRPLNKILKYSEKFENSEFIAHNIINLPCHFDMDENDTNEITDVINKTIC